MGITTGANKERYVISEEKRMDQLARTIRNNSAEIQIEIATRMQKTMSLIAIFVF